MIPKIKELDGYERIGIDEYMDTSDGLSVARIIFEDGVNTPTLFFKFTKSTKGETQGGKE